MSLSYLNPARWITSFCSWWLRVDYETALEFRRSGLGRSQNGAQVDDKLRHKVTGEKYAESPNKKHTIIEVDPHCSQRAVWISSIKDKVLSWNFDVFDLYALTSGRPLTTVTLALLEAQGLLDGWKIDRATMERFLIEVEREYTDSAYHNNTHAADVTQTTYVIMSSLKSQLKEIAQLDFFCIILAAAVHDLGHLGVNNDFLINSKHSRATTYNDRSVNENYHISQAFRIARECPNCNIFENFTFEEQKQARKLMIEMVLATDMAIHFDLLKRFQAAIDAQPDLGQWTEPADRSLLYQMVVHLADIANPSRPFPIARSWAERVVEEFCDQGDMEAQHGLPISPFCVRDSMNMPKAQLGFINIFLKPTLATFQQAAPEFVQMAQEHLEQTCKEWAALEASGMMLPKHLQQHSKPGQTHPEK